MEKDIGSPKAEEAADEDVQFVLVAPDGTEITDEEAMQSMLSDLQDNDDVDIQMEEDENEDTSENVDDVERGQTSDKPTQEVKHIDSEDMIVIQCYPTPEESANHTDGIQGDDGDPCDIGGDGEYSDVDEGNISDIELEFVNSDDIDPQDLEYYNLDGELLSGGENFIFIQSDEQNKSQMLDSNGHQASMDVPYSCEVCGSKFTRKSYLDNHRLIHTDEKRYRCNSCRVKFENKSSYDHHLKTSNCKSNKLSTRKSRKSSALQDYAQMVMAGETLECYICDKVFKYKSSYLKHMESHKEAHNLSKQVEHSNRKKKSTVSEKRQLYECDVCGKQFKYNSLLMNHMPVHSREKKFKCHKCGRGYKRKGELDMHQQTPCVQKLSITDKDQTLELSITEPDSQQNTKSPEKGKLGGEGRYSCEMCGKKFQYKSLLAKHEMSHSKDKKYECSACGKAYKHGEHLEKHLLTSCVKKLPAAIVNLEKLPIEITPGQTLIIANSNENQSLSTENISHQDLVTAEVSVDQTAGEDNADQQHVSMEHNPEESLHATDDPEQAQNMHSDAPYECSTCGERFRYEGSLTEHKQVHKTDTQASCNICGRTFKYRAALMKHKATQACSNACKICGKVFVKYKALKLHMLLSHKDYIQPYKCKVCDESFKLYSSLCEHAKAHDEYKLMYTCVKCSKTFADTDVLTEHQVTCQCNESEVILLLTGDIDSSIPYVPYKKQKIVKPPPRPKEIYHVMTGDKEKPYGCKHCGKGFAKKSYVKIHQACHTDAKPFLCSLCGNAYKTKFNLVSHMQTHGEKRYRCEQCGRMFLRRHELNTHMKTHIEKSKRERFMCQYCGKDFVWHRYLVQHLQRHTNADRYKCYHCDRTFTQKCHLTSHLESIENLKLYQCELCGKRFNRRQDVVEHMRRPHGKITAHREVEYM